MTVGIDLSGQRAVITGAAGDIGRVLLARLEEAGAECWPMDLASMDHPRFLSLDVTSASAVETTFAAIEGGIDILVTAAGVIAGDQSFLGVSEGTFDFIMGINTKGTLLCMQAAGRLMKAQARGGKMVTFSSIARDGHAKQPVYSASKAAVVALTSVAAKEWGKYGIRVNAVAPGPVKGSSMVASVPEAGLAAMVEETPLHDQPTALDIANGVLYLVSDLASFVHNHVLTIAGGLEL